MERYTTVEVNGYRGNIHSDNHNAGLVGSIESLNSDDRNEFGLIHYAQYILAMSVAAHEAKEKSHG